jgi:precorrin-4/cobalt-precorrin-4 C11-methyltransferase
VPSFDAAAAALQAELTVPEVAQSVVLTRIGGRASAMPPRETLAAFAATGATLAIHLAIHAAAEVAAQLIPFYGEDCPAVIVARASWPEEEVRRGTLRDLPMLAEGIARTALILVGPALAARDFRESALYSTDYVRRFRGGEGA